MQIIAIVVSLAITAIAVGLAVVAVRRMLAVVRIGQPAPGRSGQPGRRWATMFKETLGHTRMLQWHWIGIMHWFVMAGFIFLSSLVFGAYLLIFDAHQAFPLIGHFVVYEWPVEVLSWLTLIGIVYLIGVRQKNHPRRLERKSRFFGSTFWQAYFVEAVILAVVVLGILLRTIEYALLNNAEYLRDHPEAGDYNGLLHFPTTAWLGELWSGLSLSALENLVYLLAMVKIVVSMTWLIVISRNITMGVAWHRFTAWFNIWFKREESGGTALGAMKPLTSGGKPVSLDDLEELDEESPLGVGKVEDFSWKGILDFTSCTECGRCQSQCPAWNTEKPLSPKLLITALRDHAYAKAPYVQTTSEEDRAALPGDVLTEADRPLVGATEGDWAWMPEGGAVIDDDVLWSCTSCGACVQQCPVDIEHVDHIMDMRRYQVLVESNFPAELNQLFKGLENKGNPWNMAGSARLDWAKDLPFDVKVVGEDIESLDEVDWLFWVGCAGAYEDRAKKTTRAVAELLDMAGISFGVLGKGETCTGDPARRAGNEFVFQGLAQQNVEVFKETRVKKVVSTCAHCFNTLKNEYAAFGVELEVVHHTQLLNRLVREGKLTPVSDGAGAAKRSITYHDPCYLGRHNQVYSPPRELLQIMPGAEVVEMERNSEKSFCCGAGGARMWMEENIGERINMNRTDEAVGTGADQIAVGCPFCRVMLSDGLTMKQSKGEAREEVEVLDVAQMLLASVKGESATRAKPAEKPAAKKADAPAGGAAAGAAGAAAATDVATKAEPDAGDVTQTEQTVTDTEDVGPAAKASGGSSLFDAPADSETASPEATPAQEAKAAAQAGDDESGPSAGGSLFDLGGDDASAEPETEPAAATTDDAATSEAKAAAEEPADDLGSGGSLFDLGGGTEASTDVAADDSAPEAEAEAEAAPATEDGAETEATPVAAESSAPASASSGASAEPAAEIPEGGSLFDIEAPEPAPAAATPAATESESSESAEPAEASDEAPAEEPGDEAAPTAESTDQAPAEEPAASTDAPAEPAASGAASTPATEIPEGSSLFDIEAPEPAPAASTPAATESESSESAEPVESTDEEPAEEPSDEAAPTAESTDEAPAEEAAASTGAPAEPAASGAASTPATEIPEGGSLFDIEAPEPAPAAATPAATESESSESAEPVESTDEEPAEEPAEPATEPAADAEPDVAEPAPEPAKPEPAKDEHTPKQADINEAGSLFDL